MTRDDMIAALEAAGVEFDKRWGEKKLQPLVDALQAPADDADAWVEVRCEVPNIWTNGEPRRLSDGETGRVPASDLPLLREKVTRL